VSSNQDRNYGATNEYVESAGMEELAIALSGELEKRGLKHGVFMASDYGYESDDPPNNEMAGLEAQTKAAAKWLGGCKEDTKVCIHLHSDAGDYAHTIGIFDGRISYHHADASKGLAWHLASACNEAPPFDSQILHWDYGSLGYIFAALGNPDAVNVLIETFAHSHAPSCDWFCLDNGKNTIAVAMANKLAELYTDEWFCNETGFGVGEPFLEYYNSVGSRNVELFGFPIEDQTTEDGMLVQYFERCVMEHHPTSSWPVMLRLLGVDALRSANVATEPPKPSLGMAQTTTTPKPPPAKK